MDLKNQSVSELLKFHAAILNELPGRDVLRTANNPTGDYAEWLFCRAFDWAQAANSVKGYDATDGEGIRYQIKGRRLHQRNTSRQLSAIRDLEGFDVLAGVLFDENFGIQRAAMIPSSVVQSRSNYTSHTNSYRFLLRDDIWDAKGVQDVTDDLRRVVNAGRVLLLSPVLVCNRTETPSSVQLSSILSGNNGHLTTQHPQRNTVPSLLTGFRVSTMIFH